MDSSDCANERFEENQLLADSRVADFWEAIRSHFESNRRLRHLIIDAPEEGQASVPRIRAILQRERESGDTMSPIDPSVFLEFNVRDALDDLELVFLQAAWGAPVLTGVWGTAKEKNAPERLLNLFFEQPLQIGSYSAAKHETERLQVERFCTDWLLKAGETPYESFEPGGDPPDFVCADRGREIALECTRFSVQDRREAHAFLNKTRVFVLIEVAKNRRDYAHLRGLNVFLRFGEGEGVSGYPPKPNAKPQLREIAELLKAYGRRPLSVEGHERNLKTEISFGGYLRASRFEGAFPETPFFTKTGFELALGYQTVHSYESAWSELQSVVSAKDRPENEDLLISVGVPNQEGLVFPSEDLIADTALASGNEFTTLRYLKRVFIHFWSSRRIVQIWPERHEIAPNGFAYSLVPSYSKPHWPR